MPSTPDEIEQLLRDPHEHMALEMKGWPNPSTPGGRADIVKSLFALRNQDGGHLLLGFNKTGTGPADYDPKFEIDSAYSEDALQDLVTKYASERFELRVHRQFRDGKPIVVVEVPGDLRVPVFTKQSCVDEKGTEHIKSHRCYVRTLEASGRVSTSEISWRELPALLERCFENRESDIGRFLRRHLGSSVADRIFAAVAEPVKSPRDQACTAVARFMDDSRARFQEVLKDEGATAPKTGTWEVAAKILAPLKPDLKVNRNFLRVLNEANPNLTGWPIWMDSSAFTAEGHRPRNIGIGWEAFILDLQGRGRELSHIDYWLMEPAGRFYLLRGLPDDLSTKAVPGQQLEFVLSIIRTLEALAVGMAFAQKLAANPADGNVVFQLRWRGLKGRTLSSWANVSRYISGGRRAHVDQYSKCVMIPIETADQALAPYVKEVVSGLFLLFDGFELGDAVYEDIIGKFLRRALW